MSLVKSRPKPSLKLLSAIRGKKTCPPPLQAGGNLGRERAAEARARPTLAARRIHQRSKELATPPRKASRKPKTEAKHSLGKTRATVRKEKHRKEPKVARKKGKGEEMVEEQDIDQN